MNMILDKIGIESKKAICYNRRKRIPVSGRYYTEGKRRYQEMLFKEVDSYK